MKSFSKDRGSARRNRLALIAVLIASSCATDLQASPDRDASWKAQRSYQTSRLAARGQHPRSITCLPETNVLKRKEERRDSIADASHFRRTFLQPDACSCVAESFALSIFRPDRLIELSGTPPPAALC